MTPISLNVLIIAIIAVIVTCTYGFQISSYDSSLSLSSNSDYKDLRLKREVESFDDFPTTASANQEEESGFWDRVVKVALKLFSRFIEWLNS